MLQQLADGGKAKRKHEKQAHWLEARTKSNQVSYLGPVWIH